MSKRDDPGEAVRRRVWRSAERATIALGIAWCALTLAPAALAAPVTDLPANFDSLLEHLCRCA